MALGKVRFFLALSLLNFALSMHAQGVRALAGATYGFGAQSVRPEYASEQKDDATGPGFLFGAAYDTGADTTMHFRIRLAWQRTYWEQEFRSTYGYTPPYPSPSSNGVVSANGSVSTRMDQVVVTPAYVLPIGNRVCALFAADLGLIVDGTFHVQSRSDLVIPGSGGPHGGNGVFKSTTDSTGSALSYLNVFQLGLSAGLEMHFGSHFAAGAEFCVNTSRLVSYSINGTPPKYFRLFLGYRLAHKP